MHKIKKCAAFFLASRTEASNKKIFIASIALFLMAMFPWVVAQSQYIIHSDIAWLMEVARRFLDGQAMLQSYYETNPPLSFLIYLPAAFVTKYLLIPPFYTPYLYTLAFLLLSASALFIILRKWGFLTTSQITITIISYIAVNSIITAYDFGQRDHLLIMTLWPFIMCQFSLTYKYPLPEKLKWVILAIGAVFILVKPHYGLLPTLFLIHRAIRERRFFSMTKEPDFICLAVATVSYLLMVWFVFNDYATIIFPDVLKLYYSQTITLRVILTATLYLYIIGTIFLVTLLCNFPAPEKKLVFWILFAALIGIVPYLTQVHGYAYHLLMTKSGVMVTIGILLYTYSRKYIQNELSLFLTVLAGTIVLYNINPVNTEFPTHQNYKDLPIQQEILNHDCTAPCSFFLFDENMGIAQPTPPYTGYTFGSRFPVYWFLPALNYEWLHYQKGEGPQKMTEEQYLFYMDKYTSMVAEDFARYEPDILLIGQFPIAKKINPLPFDFMDFFSYNEKFRKEMTHYEKTGTLDLNKRVYFPSTTLDYDRIIPYDIYRRIPPSQAVSENN